MFHIVLPQSKRRPALPARYILAEVPMLWFLLACAATSEVPTARELSFNGAVLGSSATTVDEALAELYRRQEADGRARADELQRELSKIAKELEGLQARVERLETERAAEAPPADAPQVASGAIAELTRKVEQLEAQARTRPEPVRGALGNGTLRIPGLDGRNLGGGPGGGAGAGGPGGPGGGPGGGRGGGAGGGAGGVPGRPGGGGGAGGNHAR